MAKRGDGFGRWTVRWLALLGVALVVLGTFGWWLSTRVLEADGFADVVAKASQREEVRDYIADQATLRLARTSNFVSAARPVVADAVSAAIETPPVRAAIFDFAQRAHEQVFQARGARRIDVDSEEAAVTVRSALQTINPSLAKKLPANVLDATTTISQSSTVDLLFRTSRWVEDLYLPVFLAGVALLVVVMVKARDRIQAIRVVGVVLAVAGALLLGVGVASPALVVGGRDQRPAARRRGGRVHPGAGRAAPGCRSAVRRRRPPPRPCPGPRRRRPPPPDGAGAGVDRGQAHPAALALRRRRRAHGARPVRDHDHDDAVSHDPGPGGPARPLPGHRDLPARQRTARHRPHDQEVAQAPGRRRVRGDDRGDRVHGHRRRRPRRRQHRPTTSESQQPRVQRLHRAVRATAQPDRVAGEPQRDVVGRVQLPRCRAHDHDPRAAERGGPVLHARRVLRLRRQGARAHEPRRRREPRAAPEGARRRSRARARPRRCAHRRGRHVGQEAGRVLLPRLLRARRGAGEPDLPEHR